MLGSSIDTRNMQVDFSPIAQAGATMGNAFNQVGADIGGMIKLHGENDKYIKTQADVAKAIKQAFPNDSNISGMADEALAKLHDPNASQHDKLATAQGINEALKIGLLGKDDQYKKQEMALRAMELNMGGHNRSLPNLQLTSINVPGGSLDVKFDPRSGNLYSLDGQQIDSSGRPVSGGQSNDPNYPQLPTSGADGNIDGVDMGSQRPDGTLLPAKKTGGPPLSGLTGIAELAQFQPVQPIVNDQAEMIRQMAMQSAAQGALADASQQLNPAYGDPTVSQNGAVADPAAWRRPNAAPIATTQSTNASPFAGRVGFKQIPPKTTDKWRVATDEELAKYGATAGQVNENTGQFHPINPPTGWEMTSENGKVTMKQVAKGAEKAKADAEKAAKMNDLGAIKTNVVIQDTNRAMEEMKKSFGGDSAFSAMVRSGKALVMGTPEWKVKENFLASIKANITVDGLNKMRQFSPTGGALGSVTEGENAMMATLFGTLNAAQDFKTFSDNAIRIQSSMLDVAYGTPEFRGKLVQEGKLSPEVNKAIESQYPDTKMDSKGNMVDRNPVDKASDGNAAFESELKSWEKKYPNPPTR